MGLNSITIRNSYYSFKHTSHNGRGLPSEHLALSLANWPGFLLPTGIISKIYMARLLLCTLPKEMRIFYRLLDTSHAVHDIPRGHEKIES